MQAKEGVVDRLNRHLAVELMAINQYFLNAEVCRNWGFEALYRKFRELSLEEMKDAEVLVAHVLFLEGMPAMQPAPGLRVGKDVREVLQAGLDLERAAVEGLAEAITHCHQVGDYKTRAMFEEMIAEEHEHVDWFETQLETIGIVGLEAYLAQQIH